MIFSEVYEREKCKKSWSEFKKNALRRNDTLEIIAEDKVDSLSIYYTKGNGDTVSDPFQVSLFSELGYCHYTPFRLNQEPQQKPRFADCSEPCNFPTRRKHF